MKISTPINARRKAKHLATVTAARRFPYSGQPLQRRVTRPIPRSIGGSRSLQRPLRRSKIETSNLGVLPVSTGARRVVALRCGVSRTLQRRTRVRRPANHRLWEAGTFFMDRASLETSTRRCVSPGPSNSAAFQVSTASFVSGRGIRMCTPPRPSIGDGINSKSSIFSGLSVSKPVADSLTVRPTTYLCPSQHRSRGVVGHFFSRGPMTFEISIPSAPNCGARATVSVEDGHVIARLRDSRWDLGPGNEFRAECIAAVWRDRLCDAPPPDPEYVDPFEADLVVGGYGVPITVVAVMQTPKPLRVPIPGYVYGYLVRMGDRIYPVHARQVRAACRS